jgi:hypothetical protein
MWTGPTKRYLFFVHTYAEKDRTALSLFAREPAGPVLFTTAGTILNYDKTEICP